MNADEYSEIGTVPLPTSGVHKAKSSSRRCGKTYDIPHEIQNMVQITYKI